MGDGVGEAVGVGVGDGVDVGVELGVGVGVDVGVATELVDTVAYMLFAMASYPVAVPNDEVHSLL